MASNPELMKVEDTLKQKYIEIVSNLSYTEQKNFKKTEYKKLVLNDMSDMLPSHDKAQLKETAQYISNALNNKVIEILAKRARESSTVTKKAPNTLSDSILRDLDATLCSNSVQLNTGNECSILPTEINQTDQNDKDDERNFHELSKSFTDESTHALNDSITLLKQPVTIMNALEQKQTKANMSQKCCNTCTVKSKSRKSHPMTRCSLCMTWFHDQCVGLEEDEPVGVWLCLSCRQIPQGLQENIIDIKSDVEQLKMSTKSITAAIQNLSEQVTSCIGHINDKLTALSKRIDCNDRRASETLESLSDASDSLKTNLDQKTCQILNKTALIYDKVKVHCDSQNNKHVKSNNNSIDENTDDESMTIHVSSNDRRTVQSSHKQSNNRKENTRRTNNTKINANNKLPSRYSDKGNETVDTIDLTDSQSHKKTIHQSTLLVGSSIFKNIRVNELKKNTAVRSFPGATIKSLQSKLRQFNIDKCETIIIHVGGNDADQGIDLDKFSDSYTSLINDLTSENRHIIVSGLLPRASVNLNPYNERLRTMCEDQGIDFVDSYNGFLLASGDLADSYFHRDKVHPNSFGIKKMLKNIDVLHRVTAPGENYKNFKSSNSVRRKYSHHSQSYNSSYKTHFQNRSQYCHICRKNGHSTTDCWYNGRNTDLNGYRSW